MDLNHIANLAEIFGVFAIVISLIYVARQLKQANMMMKNAAASERMEREYELVLPLIESREFAEIWVKGDQNFDELDHVDQERLLFFERRAIVLWHHLFQLYEQNVFPDANWHETVWVIQNIGRRQVIREAWKRYRDNFEANFGDFVDEQFAISDAEHGESK